MRPPRINVIADKLQFDRDGTRLLVGGRDGVSVVNLGTRGGRTLQIPLPGVRAVAGFCDQIWVATDADQVLRFDHDGRAVGTVTSLPPTEPGWVPAPCGPAGVIWRSTPIAGVLDDLGAIVVHQHVDADLVLPLTARRVLSVTNARALLPSGVVAELPPGTRTLGGTVFADGRHAALVTSRGGRHHLELLALGTGQVVSRCELPIATIRIASQAPIAVLQLGPRMLEILDLRAGRSRGTFETEQDIDELAIDPTAMRLVVQHGADVELLELHEQLRSASRLRNASVGEESPAAPEVDDGEPQPPTEAAMPIAVPGPVIASEPSLAVGSLRALAPRRGGASLTRSAALACLEVERELVLARCLVGISLGWDTRRLGYANESAHPFELEVAALVGASHGRAAQHVAEARRRWSAAAQARNAEREQTFVGSPLGDLVQEFDLTPLDVDVLMAVAAPTLWGETARLYAVLANDVGRGLVDEMLVEQLLAADGIDRYDVAATLGPDATLRRHGLVVATNDGARPFTHLTVDPIVVARLRAEPPPLPEVIRIHEHTVELAAMVAPRAPLAAILAELTTVRPHPARLVVRGRRGSGRRSLLAAIAAQANRALAVIELDQLAPYDRAARVRSLLRCASLCGLLPCLVGSVEDDARSLQDAIAAHPGAVTAVLATDESSRFPPGHLELVLPALTAGERLAHWRDVLARHQLVVADPERLSSRYRLSPGMVERAAVHVAQRGPSNLDATAQLEAAICQGRDNRLARLATRVTRLPRWSDVVLPPEVLDSLRELIGRVQHGRRVYEDWGFDAVMTTGRGLTALFDGRPGTGKTMVAGIIARELGLDLYRVDVSRLVSKWIGETEKNLAEIFDAVDDGQAIILFDEADSLFARRTEVRSSNDRYANLEVNYLLQRIDSFDGIAILTTNFGSAIDPAFRRRVSFRLSFPFPDEEAREQLWRVHLPAKLPIEGELDLGALARRFQLAGGYIRNACLRAAFLAAQEETTLAQRHLERAVQLEFQQVGKISTSGPVE